MEDWWLVRDSQGRTGWLLGRAAWTSMCLTRSGNMLKASALWALMCSLTSTMPRRMFPITQVPEYVTALSPPKSGLPFDFDQIRVFTWSVKQHRYETAFRIHPIQGFLPVKVWTQPGAERN